MDDIIIQHFDPLDLRNRAILCQDVRRFIDNALKDSLHQGVQIRLRIQPRKEAIYERRLGQIYYQIGTPKRTANDDKEIIEVFDKMGQQILILGEPGSGKTTILLMLANVLLARAKKIRYYPRQSSLPYPHGLRNGRTRMKIGN